MTGIISGKLLCLMPLKHLLCYAFVQDTRNTSFKEAAEYLKTSVGMTTNADFKPNLQLVYDHANSETTKEYIKEKNAKISYANKLYNQSKPIGDKAVANRYLQEHRNITCKLSPDIKTTGIYDHNKKEYLPALIAYARDKDGNITGGQHILLNKETNAKADIDVPKKSFGVISGSFVDLGNTSSDHNHKGKTNITIIAEGLETGLSVKQGLSEHNQIHRQMKTQIICSLGINNIKNYHPKQGEKIIIAADNDGTNSITHQTIEKAKIELKQKSAFVEIAKPEKHGDFNDILKDKENGGSKKIVQDFSVAIARHSANTLTQYLAFDKAKSALSQDEKTKIKFISQFKINEEKILNAYRADPDKGKEELDKVVKPIKIAYDAVIENKPILNEISMLGGNIDKLKLTLELSNKYNDPHRARRSLTMDKHIWSLREKYYLLDQLKEFKVDKQSASTPKVALAALIKEQEFLAGLHNEINPNDNSKTILNSIEQAHAAQQSGAIDQMHVAAR
jgi:hypothetical protein